MRNAYIIREIMVVWMWYIARFSEIVSFPPQVFSENDEDSISEIYYLLSNLYENTIILIYGTASLYAYSV
jgi:DNA-directed RNA polymerase subunit E'/Rpb7